MRIETVLKRWRKVFKLLKGVYSEAINSSSKPISFTEGFILMTITASVAGESGVRVMDAGAGYGFSTAWLILGLAAKCRENCIVEAVEWSNEAFSKLKQNIEKFVEELNLGVELVFINKDAISYLEEVNVKYRLIFVDIDKDKYYDMLKTVYSKLEENGVVVFHNAIKPPPDPNFINEAYSNKWRSILIPTRTGLLVSYKH